MKHYLSIKRDYPSHLLLYQVGSFYELYGGDSELATHFLPLRRSEKRGLCGFPVSRLSTWVPMFLRSGFSLMVVDQKVEEKSSALVERHITRIFTPGTLPQDMLADASASNFLLALSDPPEPSNPAAPIGLCWVDVTTGEMHSAEATLDTIGDHIGRINPAEILVPAAGPHRSMQFPRRVTADMGSPQASSLQDAGDAEKDTVRPASMAESFGMTSTCQHSLGTLGWGTDSALGGFYVTVLPMHFYAHGLATKELAKFFKREDMPNAWLSSLVPSQVRAVTAALQYVSWSHRSELPRLLQPGTHAAGLHMAIDPASQQSLELTLTTMTHSRKGSLLSLLDKTVSPSGGRELRKRLLAPLLNLREIELRLDAVELFVSDPYLGDVVRRTLRDTLDLQKALQRVRREAEAADPLVLINDIRTTLSTYHSLHETVSKSLQAFRTGKVLTPATCHEFLQIAKDAVLQLEQHLAGAVTALPDGTLTISPGFSPSFDKSNMEVSQVELEIHKLVLGYEAQLSARSREFAASGSARLKVTELAKYGRVMSTSKAFDSLVAKTLDAHSLETSRAYVYNFTTKPFLALIEREERAKELVASTGRQVAKSLLAFIDLHSHLLVGVAAFFARLDVSAAMAKLATEQGFVRPTLEEGRAFDVVGGRHPVVDAAQEVQFVPNDCALREGTSMWLITGPNMGGKSTFLRQNALIAIMAQMGSFVPARKAHIGIVDRILTRIGATDNLAENQSTFMIEMQETARILKLATPRSLVILDEVGRGTGTHDALALASAITHHLLTVNRSRTLSATHNLHMAQLFRGASGIECHKLLVHLSPPAPGSAGVFGSIAFSHRIVPGISDNSYGIEVAQLAGHPPAVVEEARKLKLLLEEAYAPSEAALLRLCTGLYKDETTLSPTETAVKPEASPSKKVVKPKAKSKSVK